MTPSEQFAKLVLDKVKGRVAANEVEEFDEEILAAACQCGCGNVTRVKYDPAIHGEGIEAEPGSEIWWWNDSLPDNIGAWLREAKRWRCSKCGSVCNPAQQEWRFTGYSWQHHHGYPIGHVEAERVG